MGHQRGAEPARADGGQFFRLDQPVKDIEARAVPAILLGIAQPEDPRLRRLDVERAGQFPRFLPCVDVGRDFARDEAAHRLRQRFVGFAIIRRAGAPLVEMSHGCAPFLLLACQR